MNIFSLFNRHTDGEKKSSENYIENKSTAIAMVCDYLCRYERSKDRNLAHVTLWVVTKDDDSQVDWADSSFKQELLSNLHQEEIRQ